MATGKQVSNDNSFLLVLVPWLGNQDVITIATGKQPGCPLPRPCVGSWRRRRRLREGEDAYEPSSVGKAGATTMGLEAVADDGPRFGAPVKCHLRRRRREQIVFFSGKSETRPPARLVLKCNRRHGVGDAPAMHLIFYLERVSACVFLRSAPSSGALWRRIWGLNAPVNPAA
jgi:hypothetical protein